MRQSALVALAVVSLAACSSGPGADDFTLAEIESPQSLSSSYQAELATCMHAAGYGDYQASAMSATEITGGVLPVKGLVARAIAESQEQRDATDTEAGYVASHGLDDAAAQVFYDAFLACDDARSKALGEEESDRSTATTYLVDQYQQLTSTPEYKSAFGEYQNCMAEAGWDVTTGAPPGLKEVVGAISDAATVSDPGDGWGVLGVGGATLDPAKIAAAQELEDQVVADDDRCAGDTVDPVIEPFAERYSQLFIALYGTGFGPAFHVRLW